jgi:hypothetical protein
LKTLLIILCSGIVGYIVFICYILSLSPDNLLIGAITPTYSLPPSIFRFYIEKYKALPSNYHTDTGLPAIQFVANGIGQNYEQDAACIKLIEFLLKSVADINEASKDKLGLTAMHVALLNNASRASNGHEPFVFRSSRTHGL